MAGIARTGGGINVAGDRFVVDINTGDAETPVWTPVGNVAESTPIYEVETADVSDQGSGYGKEEQPTVRGWGHELVLRRKHKEGVYNAGQEAIRTAAQGDPADNSLHVRIYEMNGTSGPKVEAYEGRVSASWEEQGGGQDAKATVNVTLTGQGPRVSITHPDAPVVPPVGD